MYPEHVMQRDVLGDSNNQGHLCLDGFLDGTSRLWGGNVYTGSICFEYFHGLQCWGQLLFMRSSQETQSNLADTREHRQT